MASPGSRKCPSAQKGARDPWTRPCEGPRKLQGPNRTDEAVRRVPTGTLRYGTIYSRVRGGRSRVLGLMVWPKTGRSHRAEMQMGAAVRVWGCARACRAPWVALGHSHPERVRACAPEPRTLMRQPFPARSRGRASLPAHLISICIACLQERP